MFLEFKSRKTSSQRRVEMPKECQKKSMCVCECVLFVKRKTIHFFIFSLQITWQITSENTWMQPVSVLACVYKCIGCIYIYMHVYVYTYMHIHVYSLKVRCCQVPLFTVSCKLLGICRNERKFLVGLMWLREYITPVRRTGHNMEFSLGLITSRAAKSKALQCW